MDSIDVATLPLSPIDAFVLSQLDGVTDLEEIGLVTALDPATLAETLDRLAQLGAVVFDDGDKRVEPLRRDPRRDHDEPIREEHVGVDASRTARRAEPPPPPAPAPPPVEETVDLDAAQRQRIDEMFERLGLVSHYALLGVERSADKATIKNAYYALIPTFHPDRYFGRELGVYKKKLDKIFERLTEAESVLTRKALRREYDRYLEARRETHAFDAVLTSIPPPPRSQLPPSPEAESPQGIVRRPASDPAAMAEQRGRALAQRLAGHQRPAPIVETPIPSDDLRERAGESLRRFVAQRRSPRVDTFFKAGQEAMAEGSWVSAVNSLRIALTLAPDDAAVRELYEKADAEAARHLASRHEASARYEEKSGHWEEAARSWQRVADARAGETEPLQRSAECYLHTSDPKRGVTPAREAVKLEPDNFDLRLTLARAYEAAGLIASALGELGRAIEQVPGDDELRAWRRRLERAR